MTYTVAQESRIGGRETNQDRAAWKDSGEAVLLVVADGMGGHLHGEVAAQIAVDTLLDMFGRIATPRLADPGAFLAAALRHAHASIVGYAAECRIPAHAAPRTTCIACVVQDGHACWAHAGDSRLYLIHGRGTARTTHTRDHSIVQRMLDEGRISAEEAARHPLRHRVFSCLGGDITPHIDVSRSIPLVDGDVVALCTDGAWAAFDERLLAELARAPITTTVPRLLDSAEATAGPGADNLTLVALRWDAAAATSAGTDAAPAKLSFDDTFIGQAPLSDMEIEKAITDLRRRLAAASPSSTPPSNDNGTPS